MAGIYLHIPFCKQACAYCNFHFTTSLRYKDELIAALIKETGLQKDYLQGAPVSTVYFGGGTPSILDLSDTGHILEKLRNTFPILDDAEITLEANPDDISPEKLKGWKEAGINRLSIGIQSFQEEELRWMNRAHNVRQSYECIELSHEAGFHNLSIDLIYGGPLLTDRQWEKNVETAVGFNIPHLSCYALTVEERTPLHKQIAQNRKRDVDPDKQAHHFKLLMNWLRQYGYEHYEVSNFARPGWRSRHNSSYWKGEKYLGLGPSAHSFNGVQRQWNIANNNAYIRSIQAGKLPFEREELSPVQQLNEYIMISLRTLEGMDLNKISRIGGEKKLAEMEKSLQRYKNLGWIEQSGSSIRLTDAGMLMADGIAAELF